MALDQRQLIEEVKRRPGLYGGGGGAKSRDRLERLALWKEVGAAVFPDWGACNKGTMYDRVLQLQKRWRSLRDSYNRELRARSSGERPRRCTYRHFKALSFLGGIDGDIDDVSDQEETTQNASSSTDPLVKASSSSAKRPKRRRVKKTSSVESQSADEAEILEPLSYGFDPNLTETDSDRLFLLSFLPEMKQLHQGLKMWVRAQIATVMQEAVTSHYNNTAPRGLKFTAVKRRRSSSSE